MGQLCRPARVEGSRFDILQPSCPRTPSRNKLKPLKVSHHDSKFRISWNIGFEAGLVLMRPWIIHKAQMKVWNAGVMSLDDRYCEIVSF